MATKRPWLGYRVSDRKLELFRSAVEPTEATHGDTYFAVVGPFRTAKAARIMRDGGYGNPHTTNVRDCERLARTR